MTARPVAEWAGFGPLPADAHVAPEWVPGHYATKIVTVAYPRAKRQRKIVKLYEFHLTTAPSGASYVNRESFSILTGKRDASLGETIYSMLLKLDELEAEFARLAAPRSTGVSYVFRVRMQMVESRELVWARANIEHHLTTVKRLDDQPHSRDPRTGSIYSALFYAACQSCDYAGQVRGSYGAAQVDRDRHSKQATA